MTDQQTVLLVEACESLIRQRRFNDAQTLVHIESGLKFADAQLVLARALDRIMPR